MVCLAGGRKEIWIGGRQGVRGIADKFEWRDKRQNFEDREERRNEYLELFWSEVVIPVVEKFLGCSAKSHDGAGDVELSSLWPARACAWIVTVALAADRNSYICQIELIKILKF